MVPDRRLQRLGIDLPAAPAPLGAYGASRQAGSLIFLSGMLPLVDGAPLATGRVTREVAREAARVATLNALAVLQARVGSLDHVRGVVRATVYVSADAGFTEHAFVADGASTLLNRVFPASDRHARLAVGVSSLPMGVPVELELIVEVGA
jgi:enamine deaminase RidA (YjgF/YER057c/UK114 family)